MEIQSLNGKWKLIALSIEKNPMIKNDDILDMTIPGDLNQTLINQYKIENIYVDNSKWELKREFNIKKNDAEKVFLRMTRVKSKASLMINDEEIGYMENEYKSHYFDISDYIKDGDNTISICFESLRRNTSAIGFFGDIDLIATNDFLLRDYSIIPVKTGSAWNINTKLEIESFIDKEILIITVFKERKIESKINLKRGIGIYEISFAVKDESVDLWWPNGYGKQHLYPIDVSLGDVKIERFIAFRTVEVKKSKNLALVINGKALFMKGANWSGTRDLPNNQFSKLDARYLEAFASANMNMIRIPNCVGYERDEFYNRCDRLGIAIWQMLPDKIDEEEYTLLEIKSHPSIVLWSAEGKDAQKLERREKELDPSRPFYIEREENHSHVNWLSGDDSDAYHKKTPDFITQFGLASYPNKQTLIDIAKNDDINLTSIEMEQHQEKKREIEEIFALIARNFNMPLSNDKLIYLSQTLQAMAVTDATMGWRAMMPYTMGTLFSSLNDIYPSISQSSIDYNGRAKLLHYAAKRFFSSLTPLLFIENDKLVLYASNDTLSDEEVEIKLKFRYFNGKKKESHVYNVKVPSMTSVKVKEVDLKKIDRNNLFAYAKMQNKNIIRERTVLLARAKTLKLEKPEIKAEIEQIGARKATIKLSSSKPAFFVSMDSGSTDGIFSDNFIALRPTAEKNIIFDSQDDLDIEKLKNELTIMDLYSAMN